MAASEAGEKFHLKWNEFESNVSGVFRELRSDGDFFDVTIATEGKQLEAHKVILSACSPFFRGVLKRNPHPHPLLYMKGVKGRDMAALLAFMYHGEVNIGQEELPSFLRAAEELQVKGLTQDGGGGTSLPAWAQKPLQRNSHQTLVQRPEFQQEGVAGGSGAVATTEENSIKTEHQQAVDTLGDPGGEQEELEGPDLAEVLGDITGQDRSVLNDYVVRIDEHTGSYKDNSWSCTVCGKVAANKTNLINHVESAHFAGTFQNTCTRCGKEMKTRNALNMHIKREHRQKADSNVWKDPHFTGI